MVVMYLAQSIFDHLRGIAQVTFLASTVGEFERFPPIDQRQLLPFGCGDDV